MKKILSLLFIVFLSFQLVNSAYAEVKLPAIISSNMVLQHNTEVALWGWVDAEEEITIQASWLTEVVKTKADESGNWVVGTLFDVNLLPASSFRTDNWDDATRFGN
jgi:sialate O-acetylesterase